MGAPEKIVRAFWAGFLHGEVIPGTLSPTANSAWASLKSHPKQRAQDLSDIGYSVKRVAVAWQAGDQSTPAAATLGGNVAFRAGAQECREMMARFVEQGGGIPIRGGPHVLIAQSIRANWNPAWGPDPGPPRNMRDHGWLGPDLHDKAEALIAGSRPAESSASPSTEGSALLPPAEPLPPLNTDGETASVADTLTPSGRPASHSQSEGEP